LDEIAKFLGRESPYDDDSCLISEAQVAKKQQNFQSNMSQFPWTVTISANFFHIKTYATHRYAAMTVNVGWMWAAGMPIKRVNECIRSWPLLVSPQDHEPKTPQRWCCYFFGLFLRAGHFIGQKGNDYFFAPKGQGPR